MIINNFLASSELSIRVINDDSTHFLSSFLLNFCGLCYLRRVFVIISYTYPVFFQRTYEYIFALVFFNNLLRAVLWVFIVFIDKRNLIIGRICLEYFTCWVAIFLLVWKGILAKFTLFFWTPYAFTVFLTGHLTLKIAFSEASISNVIKIYFLFFLIDLFQLLLFILNNQTILLFLTSFVFF